LLGKFSFLGHFIDPSLTGISNCNSLYKGLYPLWGRQIPYTMCKFATFEETVAYIYRTLGKPKESYNKFQQTGISFLGGYIAGIACAVVSHPADVMVSKLNSERKAGEGAMQAISRIYGRIGFMGLWNGLPVRIVMIGTLTAFQWLIYDAFKVYLGVSVSFLPSTALRHFDLRVDSFRRPAVTEIDLFFSTIGNRTLVQSSVSLCINFTYHSLWPKTSNLRYGVVLTPSPSTFWYSISPMTEA